MTSQKTALHQEKMIVIGFVCIIAAALAVLAYFNFQRELQEQTRLPDEAPLSLVFGDQDAETKVVVYTDPVCDKCATFHNESLTQLYEDYVKTDKIALEIRPLSIISEQSAGITELLMCGSEQQKYWQTSAFVYDALNRKNNQVLAVNAATFFTDFSRTEIAKIVKLDADKLSTCLDKGEYKDLITKADTLAYASNIYSTPTIFIADQEVIRGYSIYPYIKSRVDQEL